MNTDRLIDQWEKRLRQEGRAAGRREGKLEGKREGVAIGEARGVAIGEARGVAIGEARGVEIGATRGKAEALLAVLRARGFAPSEALVRRIRACSDGSQLDGWLTRAAVASSIAEVFPRRTPSRSTTPHPRR